MFYYNRGPPGADVRDVRFLLDPGEPVGAVSRESDRAVVEEQDSCLSACRDRRDVVEAVDLALPGRVRARRDHATVRSQSEREILSGGDLDYVAPSRDLALTV